MFYRDTIRTVVEMPARHLNSNYTSKLTELVYGKMNRYCDMRTGYVVYVARINRDGPSMVSKCDNSLVEFPVSCECIVMSIKKGDVVDAVVSQVRRVGFFATVGPCAIFVPMNMVGDEYVFQTPEPRFCTRHSSDVICAGAEVRLRIVGERQCGRDIYLVGTMRAPYMGLVRSGTCDVSFVEEEAPRKKAPADGQQMNIQQMLYPQGVGTRPLGRTESPPAPPAQTAP